MVGLCGGAAGAAGRASPDAGAAVARRDTPLHRAAESGNAAATAVLINAAADVTITNVHGWAFAAGAAGADSADASAAVARRKTPLHYAAELRNAAATVMLINAGASVNIQDRDDWPFARKETPLHRAAAKGNADVAAALIGAGADMTVKNFKGCAALRCAAWPTATAAARVPAGGRPSNTGSHKVRELSKVFRTFSLR
jgi:ankyrin repeat protein